MFVKDDETTDDHDETTGTPTVAGTDQAADQTELGRTSGDLGTGRTRGTGDDLDAEIAGQTAAGDSAGDDETDSDATTFSRTYVEKLRRESAGYRERATRADEYATRLHTALVAATGRLADASDLAFDAAHLDDAEALNAAIDELLENKPHLATRTPFGDIGQGNRGGTSEPVNLADMLRARA